MKHMPSRLPVHQQNMKYLYWQDGHMGGHGNRSDRGKRLFQLLYVDIVAGVLRREPCARPLSQALAAFYATSASGSLKHYSKESSRLQL